MPYLPSVLNELSDAAPALNDFYLQLTGTLPVAQEPFNSDSPAVQLVEDLINGGVNPQGVSRDPNSVQVEFDPGLEWDKAKEKLPDMSQAWNDFIAFLNKIIVKVQKGFATVIKDGPEAASKFRTEHPNWAIAISVLVILACLCLIFPALLAAIGFGAAGVVKGSIAAAAQAIYYGGFIPAKGLFALLQSCGATTASPPVLLVFVAITLIVGTVWFLARG